MHSVSNTTVANALFILCTIPFISAGLAKIFLKESLNFRTVLAMLLASVGVIIMFGDGINADVLFGNIMGLLTSIAFAIYAVIVRSCRNIDMLPTLILSSLIIMIIGVSMSRGNLNIPILEIALCLFWGGVLSGFANWMFIVASRQLIAGEVTLVMLLEFVLGPFWVWIFVDETPTELTILGGTLVLGAVLIRALSELQDKSSAMDAKFNKL